jgi:uncharacterized protein (DUF885 family)
MRKPFSSKLLVLLSLPAVALAAEQKFTPEEIAAESQRVNEFFDRTFDENVSRSPETAAQLGLKIDYDKWDERSDARQTEELARSLQNLATLKRDFDPKKLDRQTQLSWRLFEQQVQRRAEGFPYRHHNYPVNQMFGVQTQVPTFLMNVHRVDNVQDADAYIARVNGVPRLMDQVIHGLELRAERGIIAPKFVYPLVLDACRRLLTGAPFDESGTDNPLLADFTRKVANLKETDDATRERLLNDARQALQNSFRPAYERLISYLQELEKRAPAEGGAWQFPDGSAFYNMALRRTTTTSLSAAEIHEIGLKETARLHNEMREIMKKVKFKGDLQAFFKFMRDEPKFRLPDTEEGKQEYLRRSVEIIDAMRGRLDELFLTKPKAELEVRAVEKFREKSAGKAFYQRPAPDGSRPGYYYVNLSDMAATPVYSLEALAYHEGIPGHHMQIAIAQELEGIPKFRRMGEGYTAYSEGWGLYTELIPKEMGFYSDPYSDFGRLAMELWRAARLVVDTGLHEKRWTRQQAIDWLIKNTPDAPSASQDAINRYIVMPGQATAYKIGMIKILELRENAKKQLGDKFDIREFHDVVLTNGPVPLDVLEALVAEWVKSKT